MKIRLIRHFKVDFKWKFAYNSKEYEIACEKYDCSKVVNGGVNIHVDGVIFSSSMPRAIETSQLIFNQLPDNVSDLLREVPIKAFAKTQIILPTFIWNIIGRFQCYLNSKKQAESYLESKIRVDTILDSIISQNENCTIVAHGLILKLIIKRLIKDHFSGLNPIFIKNGVPYEFIKKRFD